MQFTSWMSYLSVSANERASSLTIDQWEGGEADAEIPFRKYFYIIWIATVLTDLKMHDNSQVIAFLSANVSPSWSLAGVVIKCPLGDVFCCIYSGGRRGHHWQYQAWPQQSADLTVTSHGAREAPSVHVSHRGQTSDIRSQLTVKIEREESERKCDAAVYPPVSLCWAPQYLETLGSFPRTQPAAWASPGPSWGERDTSSVETESRYPSHYRGRDIPHPHIGGLSDMYQCTSWWPVHSDVTRHIWWPASRHLHWPVKPLIRKCVCLWNSETWALIGNLCHVKTRFVFQSFLSKFVVNSVSEQMKRILSCQFPYCCAIIHS